MLFLFALAVIQAAILKCLDSAKHTAGTPANSIDPGTTLKTD